MRKRSRDLPLNKYGFTRNNFNLIILNNRTYTKYQQYRGIKFLPLKGGEIFRD